jgi:hypothetical protein
VKEEISKAINILQKEGYVVIAPVVISEELESKSSSLFSTRKAFYEARDKFIARIKLKLEELNKKRRKVIENFKGE